VLFFGAIPNADGCVFCCSQSCATTPTPAPLIEGGRQVFSMRSGQFVIVVEGAPGLSNQKAGTSLEPGVDLLPDLQIESTSEMGNGSAAVCDTGPTSAGGGGVPGINPPRFLPDDVAVSDALVDFACRFQSFTAAAACTFTDASGEPKIITPGATVQFCDFMARTTVLPPGDSLLTVRLRDVAGNTGPTAQIVVRVATPTPPAAS
jgi:hypothetical protein